MPGMRAGTSECSDDFSPAEKREEVKYEEASEVEGSESWTTRLYLKVQWVQNPIPESWTKTDWVESVKHSIDHCRHRPFGLCHAK
ncbi:hypothetical protein M405DRAFT_833505 [Rhizopogon salebrosus TDB-379]|nr:hypothetical protein M405DRAFT_833505 [Rhizopogon salebrosus TDB-379]